jgi:hypothetical protein
MRPTCRERFTLGKEVLTILIGVLGTIVGFYFGSAPIDNNKIPIALVAGTVSNTNNTNTSGSSAIAKDAEKTVLRCY